jgi:hypothetical protein
MIGSEHAARAATDHEGCGMTTPGEEGDRERPSGEQPGGGSSQGAPGPPPPYQPAPPAQDWPAAPPVQQPGWPAPPGYPAAPGTPQAPPPEALERPQTVRAGLGAIIAGLILSLIGIVYQFANFDDVLRQALATALAQSPGTDPATARDLTHSILVGTLVFGIVWLCLQGLFVWFAWQGRNWARVVLWVIAGLGVLGGLLTQFSSTYEPGFLRTLSLFQWLLVLAAIVLLAARRSNEWYRYRRWLRDNGRPA